MRKIKFENKKVIILAGMLALIACVSLVNNNMTEEQDLLAAVNQQEPLTVTDGEESILEHDGEILVDSINVTEIKGKSKDTSLTEAAVVTSDDLSELENKDAYFEEVRATINMDRNEILSMLTAVVDETKDGPEKSNATNQKLKIIDYMNKEKVIENLIENKGFTQALALMSDTSVNITVNKQDLSQTDVAKICDIVMRETGRTAEQIVIQSKF